MVTRRTVAITSAISLGLALTGCGSTPAAQQANWDQAKSYLDSGIAASMAAAQQFLNGPPPATGPIATTVQDVVAQLGPLQQQLDAEPLPANWKAGALQALSFIQELEPAVGQFLGPAAATIPIVIAVVEAFVNGLPAPSTAPKNPPTALTAKAAQYRK